MADAQVSGTCDSNIVWVQLPSSAPEEKFADDIPPQGKGSHKKGGFLWGKEHTNLGASVCEQQTSKNAVCDAMADAQVSGTCGRNTVWVQLPSSAPEAKTAFLLVFAFFEKAKTTH